MAWLIVWKFVRANWAWILGGLILVGGYMLYWTESVKKDRLEASFAKERVEYERRVGALARENDSLQQVNLEKTEALAAWESRSLDAEARAERARAMAEAARSDREEAQRNLRLAESELRTYLETVQPAERCEETAKWAAEQYRRIVGQ